MYNNLNNKQEEKIKALAGSIAHEVRNPLSTIIGVCDLIQEDLRKMADYLSLIETLYFNK